MKVLGMYFIIAGHIFPIGYEYIYVFSVPLFFMVSGFLCKFVGDSHVFWRKLYRSLVLPCILICTICMLYDIVALVRQHVFEWPLIPLRLFNMFVGMQGKNSMAGGLGTCWFIYSLIICKIIYQNTNQKPIVQLFVLLSCIIIAALFKVNECNLYNALLNVSLAYPFFVGGRALRVLYEQKGVRMTKRYSIEGCIVGIALVFLIQKINGSPWMFNADYGKDLLLFFVGGMAGTLAIFSISLFLPKAKYLITLSNGLILVLGFQSIVLKLYFIIPSSFRNTLTDYTAALFVLLFFIPVIVLAESFFPAILGYRTKK